MTVKRNRPKSKVTDEMSAEVTLEDATYDEDQLDDDPDKPSTRRPLEKPSERSTKSIMDYAEQITRIFASIGVALAALLSYQQYKNANIDLRSERSLELVQDWQDSKHIDRFAAVQRFVESKLQSGGRPPVNLSDEALKQASANLGYNWSSELRSTDTPEAKDTEKAIDRLFVYFGQMEICIASKLCDPHVLKAYFETEVSTFWLYFSGYATLRQEANYRDYGKPVENLVQRFERLPPE